MNNKKSMNDHPKQPASWSAILRNLPFTVRVFGLTILIGLSLMSYNIGKAVAEATAYNQTDVSFTNKRKQKTKLDDVKIRRNNGKWEFSSDEGVSWSTTPPEGLYEDEDGRLRYKNSRSESISRSSTEDIVNFPFSDNSINGTIMKRKDNKWTFSSDDGKTWTEEKPAGVEIDKDGKLTWKSEDEKNVSTFDPNSNQWKYSEDGGKTWSDPLEEIEDWLDKGITVPVEGGVSMKVNDGKIQYSTDGVKTWSEEAPEGFEDKVKSLITKQSEDGKTLYSTDGGKTWSEEKPENFTIPNVEDLLDDLPDELLPKSEDITSNSTAI